MALHEPINGPEFFRPNNTERGLDKIVPFDEIGSIEAVPAALSPLESLADTTDDLILDETRAAVNEVFAAQVPDNVSSIDDLIASLATKPTFAYNPVKKTHTYAAKIKSRITEIIGGPTYQTREAIREDIDTLVDVDIRAFGSVYKDYDVDPITWRNELRQKFAGRLEKIRDWTEVFEKDGEILGFMTSCPTSKTPESFISWEQTTDNGTLETTYDPDGENVYVVSLSMLHEGSAIKGQNMLFAKQMGKFIAGQYKQAFFESRLPGLRAWVELQCEDRGTNIDSLSREETNVLAQEYFSLTKTVKGKEVPYDRLLRVYDAVGCKFIKVLPDAYQDKPSMNYGAMCVFDNPLPEALRKSKFVSKVAGGVLGVISRSPWLTKQLF
jgi:hypothetical protein